MLLEIFELIVEFKVVFSVNWIVEFILNSECLVLHLKKSLR